MESALREYKIPAKAVADLFDRYVTLHYRSWIWFSSKQSPVYGVFDRYFHHKLHRC